MACRVPRRGWHRPVRLTTLVGVAVTLLGAWLVLMLGGVWMFYAHWASLIHVQNHEVALRVPAGTVAHAEVLNVLRTPLTHMPRVRVPLQQDVWVSVSDPIQARVRVHTVLPVDTSVRVQHPVPVRTTLAVTVPLFVDWLPRLHATVPVDVVLPIDMVVPVQAEIPVDLDVQVTGVLPPALRVPLNTAVTVRPELMADLEARVTSLTAFEWLGPQTPVPMTIRDARLRVPFDLAFLRRR